MAWCVYVSWKLGFLRWPELLRTFISPVGISRLIRVGAVNVLSGIRMVNWVDRWRVPWISWGKWVSVVWVVWWLVSGIIWHRILGFWLRRSLWGRSSRVVLSVANLCFYPFILETNRAKTKQNAVTSTKTLWVKSRDQKFSTRVGKFSVAILLVFKAMGDSLQKHFLLYWLTVSSYSDSSQRFKCIFRNIYCPWKA